MIFNVCLKHMLFHISLQNCNILLYVTIVICEMVNTFIENTENNGTDYMLEYVSKLL